MAIDEKPLPKHDGAEQFLSSLSAKIPIPSLPELLRQVRENMRPASEFLNTKNFKVAQSAQRLSNRLMRNLVYFQSNYLCIFVILMIYCLITSPLILLILVIVLFVCHKVKKSQMTLTILGRSFTTYQQCLLVSVFAAPIFYLAGAGAVMFWVLGASFFVVCAHAIFYNIDAIVTEEAEGFLTETV